MKRMIAVLMATMMLTGILTACSGSIGMDDGRAYGNVSTTPDGRVNGGGYESGSNNGGMTGNGGGMFGNGTDSGASSGMTGNGNSTGGGMFGGNANSGTGMTGGR